MKEPQQDRAAALLETLLFDYAAGTLDEAASLLIAALVTLNPQMRRSARVCEDLGGTLMEHTCSPVGMKPGGLERVLARLAEENEAPPPAPEKQSREDGIPRPLQAFLDRRGELGWTPEKRASKGVEACVLSWGKGESRLRMMRFAPAASLPSHRHTGTELMLVLTGGLASGDRDYERGDIVVIERRVKHETRADGQTGCLCLELRLEAFPTLTLADRLRDVLFLR